jgi:hypothetical protein
LTQVERIRRKNLSPAQQHETDASDDGYVSDDSPSTPDVDEIDKSGNDAESTVRDDDPISGLFKSATDLLKDWSKKISRNDWSQLY